MKFIRCLLIEVSRTFFNETLRATTRAKVAEIHERSQLRSKHVPSQNADGAKGPMTGVNPLPFQKPR